LNEREYTKKLIGFAKKALHGLDESHVFVGVLSNPDLDKASIEFMIQLGRCILLDKPIIIPVPFGVEVPPKLRRVADRIVRYDLERPESLMENITVALTEMGLNIQ
jgi:hypothetical protein